MWIFTSFGFFSVVQKRGMSVLTVRARVASDLDRLREAVMPDLSATVRGAGTDYPYRATIDHSAFAAGMARIAGDIHYDNFKSEVSRKMGHKRAHAYHKVWAALVELEEDDMKYQAYGGVVFNGKGEVLLRKPKGQYGDYVWTFAKGGAKQNETPEQNALREVKEESGATAKIICRLPGGFEGDMSVTYFYLMEMVSMGPFQTNETEAIEWVHPEEAPKWIQMTTSTKGRDRDLEVLRQALLIRASQTGQSP